MTKKIETAKQYIRLFVTSVEEWCYNLLEAEFARQFADSIEADIVAPKSYEYQDMEEEGLFDDETAKEYEEFENKTMAVGNIAVEAESTADNFISNVEIELQLLKEHIDTFVSDCMASGKYEDIKTFAESMLKNNLYTRGGKNNIEKLLDIVNDEEFQRVCKLKNK